MDRENAVKFKGINQAFYQRNLVQLPEWAFDRKRIKCISANSNPDLNSNANPDFRGNKITPFFGQVPRYRVKEKKKKSEIGKINELRTSQ